MSKKVEMFRCDICNYAYPTEFDAKCCEFVHYKYDLANYMLEHGKTLYHIKLETNIFLGLPDELKDVTKDTAFKISYLQCNDGYVYKISHIDESSGDIVVYNTEDHHVFKITYQDLVRGLEKKDESE